MLNLLTDKLRPPAAGFRLLPLAFSLAFISCPHAAEDKERKRRHLQEVRSQIKQSEHNIRKAQSDKRYIQTDLMRAEKKISYIGHRLHIIRKDYVLQEERWHELRVTKEEREAVLDKERQRLGELLHSAYKIDRYGDVRLLLGQENPALVSRMMTYHDYFSRQRIEQIKRINERLAELETAQHALSLQSRTLDRLKYKRQQELAKLNQMKQQKQLALADIRRDINNEGLRLSQLRKNEQTLKEILRSLTDLLGDTSGIPVARRPFLAMRGKLPWPSTGKIITHFGSARGDSGKNWSGVVIDTERGGDVIAIARGRVAFSEWLRGYGLLLIMDHGDGYISLYGHNESVYKDTGEWVESGEVIASVGDSGGQSRTGLYFEIRYDGKPVNPVKWCATKEPPVNG